MYQLSYKKQALKALAKMPTGVRSRMECELKTVAADPASYRGDWKPLTGSPYWRLRAGAWRAVCDRQAGRLVLLVVKIGSRGDVYK